MLKTERGRQSSLYTILTKDHRQWRKDQQKRINEEASARRSKLSGHRKVTSTGYQQEKEAVSKVEAKEEAQEARALP